MQRLKFCAAIALLQFLLSNCFAQSNSDYENFDAAIYTRYYEVQQMADRQWLESNFAVIENSVQVNKIYLETHRDMKLVDAETLRAAIAFFENKGIEVAGGITLTISEPNRFETFCYSNPEHRAWVQEVVEFTARHFDEFILDDFFFTSCKSELEIEAKGQQSWTEYRLALMRDAANDIVIGPAKAVNPDVKVVIKYPNWYEHFQGLGFNLESQPGDFDGLYTGTETRDAVRSAQHLQPYLGYQIFRYFNNLAPGKNGGGWVDTGGATSADRYAEQLWLTLFAKAPEITLFDFRQMQVPLTENLRGSWQGQNTSFDYDTMLSSFAPSDNTPEPTFAHAAGHALELVDAVIGELGIPVGVKSYRPYHASGEDFLHNYLGMIGIPIDLYPEFPVDADTVLLTESAKFDDEIVEKIEAHIRAGNNVVITSGLLSAIQDKGLHHIAEISVSSRKALVKDFQSRAFAPISSIAEPVLIPQLTYLTNDSWELVSALAGQNGWPLLHDAEYGDGHLYVLAVPDNFTDLYRLPADVLAGIRQPITQGLDIMLDAPGQVSLFMYDNNTVIVESFLDEEVEIALLTGQDITSIQDLQNNDRLRVSALPASGGFGSPQIAPRNRFPLSLKPHSFRIFRYQ